MGVVTDLDRPDLGGNLRHGDINTFCPNTWRFLVERFAVRSVLDVGCGEGHAVAFFRRLGLVAHGIDGLLSNVLRAVTPVSLHDICAGPFIMPVDLVWSCEVAEHIPESHVDSFLGILANGKVIAMTAALPDQPGYHHVNCQPREYWVAKMDALGYSLSGDMDIFKHVSGTEANHNYFQQSGLVFVREKSR